MSIDQALTSHGISGAMRPVSRVAVSDEVRSSGVGIPAVGEPKIEARNLDFFYGSFQALKGISMSVPSNRITALIGPSGCGKSTFIRTLNRMNDLVPGARHTGSINLDGEDIYAQRANLSDIRKRVGMVFQKPNPFPMSIYENIAYGPRTHGVRNRAYLDEVVEKTLTAAALWDEVKDKLKQSAYALSGGQQQRLCIARVLAVGPEVILMDEPCSALDPVSTFHIEQLISELKAHYTIVIVTHNLQQASRVSDQTAFFLKGELREIAPTDRLFTAPTHSDTEAYISGRFG